MPEQPKTPLERFLASNDLTIPQITIPVFERKRSILHLPVNDNGSLPTFREHRLTVVVAFTRREWLEDFAARGCSKVLSATSMADLNAHDAFRRAMHQGTRFVRINPGKFLDRLMYSDDFSEYHEPGELELALRKWVRWARSNS